jgi:hypothetical protein
MKRCLVCTGSKAIGSPHIGFGRQHQDAAIPIVRVYGRRQERPNEINVYGHVRGLGTLAVDHRVRLNIIPL